MGHLVRALAQFTSKTICLTLLFWFSGSSMDVRADRIDDYITSQMREQNIPGLSIAVVKEGRVVIAKGYGLANVELKVPATAETVYHLASVTKQFTATAIMLLVQDGKLGLDDKINRYLKNASDNWRDVTIRQLLAHMSGIKDHLNEMNAVTMNGTNPEEIASYIGKLPLNFTPGTRSFYSNTGYLVLGMIIEAVSGKSYDRFLMERVFNPLGMSRTRRNSLDDIIANRAAGYFWTDGKLLNSPFFHPSLYDNADDGLISTVSDLARWDAALYEDSILSSPSRTQMWSPMKLVDGSAQPFGFGWLVEGVNGHRLVYHNGNRPDASTFIGRYLDDKLTVIVLTNLSGANPGRIGRQIAGFYIPALMPVYDKPIADAEPQVTSLLKTVLLKLQDGTINSEPFTSEMWNGLYPVVTSYLRGFLSSSGPFKSIDLLAREEKKGQRGYRYRAVFRDKTLIIDCTLTKESKISEMSVAQE